MATADDISCVPIQGTAASESCICRLIASQQHNEGSPISLAPLHGADKSTSWRIQWVDPSRPKIFQDSLLVNMIEEAVATTVEYVFK